jgi:hypothetical protein
MFASGAVQGVAFADGAGPITTKKPMAVTDAIDSDTIRGIAVKVTPFQEQAVALTSAVAYVTIVVRVANVTSDPRIGIHPRPCRNASVSPGLAHTEVSDFCDS